MIKREADEDFETQRPYSRNSLHVGCENKSDTGSTRSRGDWNHFKITQAIPEQHTEKARN
jgi:hypothetical protein